MENFREEAVRALLAVATSAHCLEISSSCANENEAADIQLVSSKPISSFEPVASIPWERLLDVFSARRLLADLKVLEERSSQLLDVDCISMALAVSKAQGLEQYQHYIKALPCDLPGLQWCELACYRQLIPRPNLTFPSQAFASPLQHYRCSAH